MRGRARRGETPALSGVDLTNRRLRFTPTAAGTYTMTVTASDDNGNSDTEEVVITVSPAATVSVPTALTVAEGVGNATVRITAGSTFGKAVTLSVSYGGTATGAADPANGDYDNDAVTSVKFGVGDTTKDIVIPITDDDVDDDDETITVTIAAAEGVLAAAGFALGNATTTVTITDDDASPVLDAIDDVTVRVGQEVNVRATATDADGDTIGYAWARKAGETPALSGVDLTNRRLRFTPTAAGTYTMTVTASDDNGNSDTEEVVITVSPAATVSVPTALTVAEGVGNATVRITAGSTFGKAVTLSVSYGGTATGAADPANGDYDNDAVTSVKFGVGDTTKDIVIPITDDDVDDDDETITVTIAAAEGVLAAAGFALGNATTTVTITDDDSSPVLDAIDDVTVRVGQEVNVRATATDADGDTIGYAWARKAGETPALSGVDLTNRRLRFTPTAAGTYTMTVTASDDNGNSDTEEVVITVMALPVLELTGTTANGTEGRSLTLTLSSNENISGTLEVAFAVQGSSSGTDRDAAVADFNGGVLSGITTMSFAGGKSATVSLPLTDDDEIEGDEAFRIRLVAASGYTVASDSMVLPGTLTDNDGIRLKAETKKGAVIGTTLELELSAVATTNDGSNYSKDADFAGTLSGLTWGYAGGDAVASDFSTVPSSATFASGVAKVEFEVSGNVDVTETDSYSIGLSTVSGHTVVNSSNTVSGSIGGIVTMVIDSATYSQEEGEVVKVTVNVSPAPVIGFKAFLDSKDVTAVSPGDFTAGGYSLSFDAGDTSGTLSIQLKEDSLDEDNETFEVMVTGSDQPSYVIVGDPDTATVTITDDDSSPVLVAIEDVSLRVGQAVDVTASATDADEGATISYAWTRKAGETSPAIPQGTALNQARLTFTPPAAGTYTMTVTASDGNGNTDTEDVVITVSAKAQVSVPAALTVAETGNAVVTVTVDAASGFGQAVTFNVTYGGVATGAAVPANGDYDNDAVTSVAFGASDTTKDITIPITADQLDEADETFTVTIAPSAALPAGFALGNAMTTVTITDDDSSPVLAAIADVTVRLGQAVDVTASATDADNDSISYAWTRKTGETAPAIPQGTALNQARLTFTAAAVGTYTMTVTASDGNGNSDTEEVTVTVTAKAQVSVPATLTVAETGNATVRITAGSAFGQAVTFNVTYGGDSATGAAVPPRPMATTTTTR